MQVRARPRVCVIMRCSSEAVKNLWEAMSVVSDGQDKLFCTKAITIIDNFKKALGDTDNQ